MVNVIDQVPYKDDPKGIETTQDQPFGGGKIFQPIGIVLNEVIREFGCGAEYHRKNQGEQHKMDDLFFDGFFEDPEIKDAKPHDVGKYQTQDAGKEQADVIFLFCLFAKCRYKKNTDGDVHRPSNDLAPPVY
jgi:hypothetical protein